MKSASLVLLTAVLGAACQGPAPDNESAFEPRADTLNNAPVSETDIEGWQPYVAGRPSERRLIFSFPDGVRGGFGKIRGTAAPDSPNGYGPVEQTVAACGGQILPSDTVISHRESVITTSGPADLQIVRCVQRTTARHFNVYQAPAPTAAESSGRTPEARNK
ncbi:MAG TPA: hypothetical protein VF552_16495 [Allosphingosinicella sp.]|jgi:hypothetical protein